MSERSNYKDMCDLFLLTSQKQCMLSWANVSMKHIYKVTYNISVYIKTFDFRWHLYVNLR